MIPSKELPGFLFYDPDPLSGDQQVEVTVKVENNIDGGGRIATDVTTEVSREGAKITTYNPYSYYEEGTL